MNGLTASHAQQWARSGHVKPPEGFDPKAEGEDAFDRTAKLFRQVFGGQAGAAVLDLILTATLFRPPVDHRLRGEDYLRFAQLREGENAAAAVILAYLNHAQDLEEIPNARSGSSPPDPEQFAGSSFWRSGAGPNSYATEPPDAGG